MQPVQIVITFTPDGRLGLQSNVPNVVMALGMLQMAGQQMVANIQKAQAGIEIAPPGLEVARNRE